MLCVTPVTCAVNGSQPKSFGAQCSLTKPTCSVLQGIAAKVWGCTEARPAARMCAQVLRLWEALWSGHLSGHLHLFMAAGVLGLHRRAIMEVRRRPLARMCASLEALLGACVLPLRCCVRAPLHVQEACQAMCTGCWVRADRPGTCPASSSRGLDSHTSPDELPFHTCFPP